MSSLSSVCLSLYRSPVRSLVFCQDDVPRQLTHAVPFEGADGREGGGGGEEGEERG